MRVLTVRSKRLFFAVRVIVYCLKSIGLAPFSVPMGNPAGINPREFPIRAFVFSKIGLAYNLLLLIPVTVVSIVYTPTTILKRTPKGAPVVNILSIILTAENILSGSSSCLIIISWAFGQRRAASVLNRLLEVDVRLSGLKKRPFDKCTLIFLALHIILNACLWITFWTGIITFFEDSDVLIEFLGRLPEYINYWFVIEYITVVGLVARDLETVNECLLNFKLFGNHFYCSSQILGALKSLRGIRTTLFELCNDIDDFFSLPISFTIARCFVAIFERLYRISRGTDDNSQGLTICLTLVFVLKYIYPVVSLALNVTRTRKEAESSGPIVSKLLAEASSEEIRAELEQFSLQLLHEKVDFTAYGLFPLDSTMLQSMLGGVASYAIILAQFGSSACNCNCNCSRNDTSTE